MSTEGTTAWYAEYDEWGNLLNEENPHQLQQLIRLPGQTEGGMEPVWISIESDIRHRPPGFIYVGGCKIGGMY
nr:hypothetical protein [Escherichia coli]